MSFDDDYSKTQELFGAGPEALLRQHVALLARGAPALDVGAGQGRNALWLASQGFEVEAIDPSRVAVDHIERAATAEGLVVRASQCALSDFRPEPHRFGTVMVFGIVQILTWAQIAELRDRIMMWLCPGGHALVTAFTIADPAFERIAGTWKTVGRNCFENGAGARRTYMEPGELPRMFPGLHVVHHWEGLGPEHRHGEHPPERHGMVELVVRAAASE